MKVQPYLSKVVQKGWVPTRHPSSCSVPIIGSNTSSGFEPARAGETFGFSAIKTPHANQFAPNAMEAAKKGGRSKREINSPTEIPRRPSSPADVSGRIGPKPVDLPVVAGGEVPANFHMAGEDRLARIYQEQVTPEIYAGTKQQLDEMVARLLAHKDGRVDFALGLTVEGLQREFLVLEARFQEVLEERRRVAEDDLSPVQEQMMRRIHDMEVLIQGWNEKAVIFDVKPQDPKFNFILLSVESMVGLFPIVGELVESVQNLATLMDQDSLSDFHLPFLRGIQDSILKIEEYLLQKIQDMNCRPLAPTADQDQRDRYEGYLEIVRGYSTAFERLAKALLDLTTPYISAST